MTIKEEVAQLVHQVPHAPERPIPKGATEEEIVAFSSRTNLQVPDELHEWLSLSNGPRIGPGGLFGILPTEEQMRIESLYELFPAWREKGWIPVAGDGCGNYFVLDSRVSVRSSHPIYFVDHEDNYVIAQYVVASGLWQFLRFLLRTEFAISYWPFDKEKVLENDPALQEYKGDVPFPWSTIGGNLG